jgi:hypothetical protein
MLYITAHKFIKYPIDKDESIERIPVISRFMYSFDRYRHDFRYSGRHDGQLEIGIWAQQ